MYAINKEKELSLFHNDFQLGKLGENSILNPNDEYFLCHFHSRELSQSYLPVDAS